MNKYGISEAKSSIGFKTYAVQNVASTSKMTLKGLLLRGAVFVSAFSMVLSVFAPVNVEVANAASVTWTGNGTTDGYCSNFVEDETQQPAAGNQIWQFNLTGIGTAPYSLTASFDDGTNFGPTAPNVVNGNVAKWFVETEADAKLLSATGDNGTDPGRNSVLTVSHCVAGEEEEEDTKLTLVKVVSTGDANPNGWTLTATLQGELDSTLSGITGVSGTVDPGTYELDEDEENGPKGYEQVGDWTCVVTGTDTEVLVDDSEVVIEEGDDVTCTVVNGLVPDPEVPQLHLIKVVCDEFSDISGHEEAELFDATNGNFELFKNYNDGEPNFPTWNGFVSPSEIPDGEEGCERASGWEFTLSTDQAQTANLSTKTTTVNGEYVTPISGDSSDLSTELKAGILDGNFWVSEVVKDGYSFGAIRCYNDALNGDNLEKIDYGSQDTSDIYCIAYNVELEPQEPPCVDGLTWATQYYDFNPGLRKNNTAVLPERSDPTKALGTAQNNDTENFVSLGFGGSIVLSFGGTFVNGIGADIKLVETSYNSPSDANYPEKVRVEVSMNQAGPWTNLGEFFQDEEVEMGAVSQANYIKLTDVSDKSSSKFNNETDGYDVDGVRVNVDCTPPEPEKDCDDIVYDIAALDSIILQTRDNDYGSCSISGNKYRDANENGVIDEGDQPVEGWTIYLDNDGNCFQGEGDVFTQTDVDGHYQFTNLDAGEYYVCEDQKSGWNQLIPDPEVSKYHLVTLTDTSVADVDFLNELEKDPCKAEYDNGEEPELDKLGDVQSALIIEQYEYSISGCKFYGETDQRLEGWQIYVDLNKNGSYDNGEPTDTTDANGYYKIVFNSGDHSLPYHVREVLQSGWIQTYPSSPYYHEVWLGYNQDDATGIDFRNEELPEPCVEIDLISNGSFENPVVENEAGWDVFPSGSANLDWLITWADADPGLFNGDSRPLTANIEFHGGVNGWDPSEGEQYAELDSDWAGPSSGTSGEPANIRVSQVVDASTGVEYELSFDHSPRPGNANNIMEVYWNGVLVDTISADGTGKTDTEWTTHTFTVVGEEGNDLLEFREVGTSNSLGSFLDNVKLLGCEDEPENPGGGGSSSSTSSGSRSSDRPGRVLGDSTPGLQYEAPQVLGVSTELPRTGTPIALAFSFIGILAIIMVPKLAKVKQS